MDFFLTNNTYLNTEKSKWTLDDGYSLLSDKNVLFNIIPARTSGVSYYHRLRLKLHTTENGFSVCPNTKFDEDFFLVRILCISNYFMSKYQVYHDQFNNLLLIVGYFLLHILCIIPIRKYLKHIMIVFFLGYNI